MTRRRPLVALALAEVVVLLLLAEGLTAALRLDLRLILPLLRFQGADLAVHRVSENPDLQYELAPGARAVFPDGRTVTVNALGFRGAPRTAEKPKGTFRVICLGGSNTYGAAVGDGETYPAELERALNARGRRRFEVWNGGLSASVLSQNVAAARVALERYSPDLLLFQVGNCGPRPYLDRQPWRPFFRRDPGRFAENLKYPHAGAAWHRALSRASGFYRVVAILVNRLLPDPTGGTGCTEAAEAFNDGAFADFYAQAGQRVRMAVVAAPFAGVGKKILASGAPVLNLKDELPPGAGPEFNLVHPPARVYRWYAQALVRALQKQGLILDAL